MEIIYYLEIISCLKSNHNFEDYNITFLGKLLEDLSKNLDKNI